MKHSFSQEAGRYACIDLKSFYASVECAERGLDPFACNLVVADRSRGRTTICLAVTPALKARGVRNRCRLFEIPEGIPYTAVRPRMRRYMEVSAQIYRIYLRYLAPEDIHPYSIDECFLDLAPYQTLYGAPAQTLVRRLMEAVRVETGIFATAGIGTNLFLAKVALDIEAKRMPDGIGYLDEERFKRTIWHYRPITDIWNIGPGIARRLARLGAYDLHGITQLREETLYREFGANAEFLIDHAWGQEPCTMADIHAYRPKEHSLVNGQVLPGNYTFEEARTVLREMVDESTLELAARGVAARRIALSVGYTHSGSGVGEGTRERTSGSRTLPAATNSYSLLLSCFEKLFAETARRDAPLRRLSLSFELLVPEYLVQESLFDDSAAREKEHAVREATRTVKSRFGKNALLKGTSFRPEATGRERNGQIGGHHA